MDPTEAEDAEEGEEESASLADPGSTKAKAAVGTIENREDAFREILKISQYFRKTEPHSPISYALEQIVRWGRLPLPDLLKELISDESSVSQMFKLVGIKTVEDPMEGQY
jgi:type VI secretion system protein ImpA